jgi:hypothetical protein
VNSETFGPAESTEMMRNPYPNFFIAANAS